MIIAIGLGVFEKLILFTCYFDFDLIEYRSLAVEQVCLKYSFEFGYCFFD
jgi:hypothetical protein